MSIFVNTMRKRPIRSMVSRVGIGAFAAIAAALLWCCVIVGTAWAQMSNETETRFNVFASRDLQIVIVENGVPVDAGQKTVSFGEANKRVALEIPSGRSDAAVRLTFAPQIAAQDSTEDDPTYYFFNGGTLSEPVNDQVVMGDITLHMTPGWKLDWIYQEGFFYYRHFLKAGERTPDLLQGVTKVTQGEGTVEVVISAEGLQPQHDVVLREWGVSIE